MKIVIDREKFYEKIEKHIPEQAEFIENILETTLKHYDDDEDVFLCIDCGKIVDVTSALCIDDVIHIYQYI